MAFYQYDFGQFTRQQPAAGDAKRDLKHARPSVSTKNDPNLGPLAGIFSSFKFRFRVSRFWSKSDILPPKIDQFWDLLRGYFPLDSVSDGLILDEIDHIAHIWTKIRTF